MESALLASGLEIDGDTSQLSAAPGATPKLKNDCVIYSFTPTSVLEIDGDTSKLSVAPVATPKLKNGRIIIRQLDQCQCVAVYGSR
jgi:hypothetical protein